MKKTVPVFLLLFVLLSGSTSYAGVISGGTAGTQVWVQQTATTDIEWSEYYTWNVTAYSPITVHFDVTPTAQNSWCSWEVDNSGSSWGMGNLVYPADGNYYTETWNADVVPGIIGLWGGAGNVICNISITWGWPE